MREAPTTPNEAQILFPFAITYDRSGELILQSSSWAYDLATIVSEIHVARQILAKDIALAMTFREPFLRALIGDQTLNSQVASMNAIRYAFGKLEYAGDETIGYRFEIDIKLHLTV